MLYYVRPTYAFSEHLTKGAWLISYLAGVVVRATYSTFRRSIEPSLHESITLVIPDASNIFWLFYFSNKLPMLTVNETSRNN